MLVSIVGVTYLFGPPPWLIDHPTRTIHFVTIVKVTQEVELVVLEVIPKVVNSVTVGRDILGILQKVLLFGSVGKMNGTQDSVACDQSILQKGRLSALTERD